MPQPELYFVRHGQTDWNAESRLQGQTDIPLNETGRDQARKNGETLAGRVTDPARFRFISSPLGRTRETMEIVRRQLELPTEGYETDDRLKELSFGTWEGSTFQELKVTDQQRVTQRRNDKWGFVPPDGESYAMLLQRIRGWLADIREPGIIACHGGVIRVLEHHFNATPTAEVAQQAVPQDRVYHWDGQKGLWV